MAYNRINWQNFGVTPIDANNLNKMDVAIESNDKRSSLNEKAVAELMLLAEIDGKISDNNLNKFYADGVNDFQFSAGQIDFTKGNAASVVSGSTIVISNMLTGSFTDFKVGQEVTLQDGTQREDLVILSTNGVDTLTFTTTISGTYAGNANLYRSNLLVDSGYKFGGVSSIGIVDWTTTPKLWAAVNGYDSHIGSVIINQALYAGFVKNGTGIVILKFDGSDSELCRMDSATLESNKFALKVDVDNNIIVLGHNGTTDVLMWVVDTTVATGDIFSSAITVDNTGNTEIEQVLPIIIGSDIFIAYRAKNTGATNSSAFNVRARIGTITSGVPSFTILDQVTDISDPIVDIAVEIDGGIPVMLINFNNVGSRNFLIILRRDALLSSAGWLNAPWTQRTIDAVGAKYEFFMEINRAGLTDDGRILMVHREINDARVYYTDDGGLTDGSYTIQTNATEPNSIVDSSGVTRYSYVNSSSDVAEKTVADGSTTPSTEATLITGTYTQPQYTQLQESSVENSNWSVVGKEVSDFKQGGELEIASLVDVLETVIRMEITPFDAITAIASYLTHNGITGVTVDGLVSIVDDLDPESYNDLTDTDYPVGTDVEVASADLPSTPGDKVTLKYVLSRLSTSDAVLISKILGGVS